MKKGKFCVPCGRLVGNRTLKCTCGYEFKKIEKPQPNTSEPKTWDIPGRGRKLCSCGKYYGAKCIQCPSCLAISEEKEVIEPWPDNWNIDAQKLANQLGISGTAVYASSVKCKKPKLTFDGIRLWADEIFYEYYAESKQTKFLTMQALRLLLRRFFIDAELTLALTLLEEWRNSYESV